MKAAVSVGISLSAAIGGVLWLLGTKATACQCFAVGALTVMIGFLALAGWCVLQAIHEEKLLAAESAASPRPKDVMALKTRTTARDGPASVGDVT